MSTFVKISWRADQELLQNAEKQHPNCIVV